ncbi:MAG TPA: methylated-DNA--[protein]-cysteine S-methyltransferase [Methylomirabilota bacterium]|nr:methylated-DNA--[protein]-cysteine S-methyltransferase [Methylomirabilota bacterium]
MSTSNECADYDRVESALRYLHERRAERPSLDDVARHVGLSPAHFQRLFVRWAGVSPKRFLQFLTAEQARRCLAESRSVLDAAFDAGLSSPGRLHDLTVAVDAVTPGELRSGGAGMVIRHGLADSPFGRCFIAATDRGVCALSFSAGYDGGDGLAVVRATFPEAELRSAPGEIAALRDRIFRGAGAGRPLSVLLAGTNFQLKVWEALLRIPAGRLCAYSDLAELMGRPTAARAVASAAAANRVAYLIPCHRVIRSLGDFGDYRWGPARKRAMAGWEAARGRGGVEQS